jgi:hypothetical protein
MGMGAGEPEVVGEGQQALLGAVVQVAFQPAAFAVAGLHDADPGGAQLVELGQRLGLQSFVLQRQPDGGAEFAFQVGQRRGVGDDRDLVAVADQRGDRTARGGDGLGDRPAGGVHVVLGVGQPVGDLELGIADGLGERCLQGPGRGRLAEAGRDPGDGAALGPGADCGPRQPGGEQDDRGAPKGVDGAERRIGGVFQWSALQRGRVRDDGCRQQESWQGDRQQRAACWPGVPQQPPGTDGYQCGRGGRGEPAVRHLDGARQLWERAHQEVVVGAVGPAVGVEEGLSEQRQPKRGERGLQIDGEDQRSRDRPAWLAAGEGEDQVEQQREGQAGGEHAEAADQRGSLVPAHPHRCKPDQPGEHGQVTDPPCRAAERGDQAGQD